MNDLLYVIQGQSLVLASGGTCAIKFRKENEIMLYIHDTSSTKAYVLLVIIVIWSILTEKLKCSKIKNIFRAIIICIFNTDGLILL